jgi:hypothetical protein
MTGSASRQPDLGQTWRKMKHTYTIVGLVILIFLLDLLFRPIYPTVDPIRASLVGIAAYAVLFGINKLKAGIVEPLVGAIAIFTSAILSVMLIHVGLLVSKSPISAVVHIVILAVAYLVAAAIAGRKR